MSLISSNRNKKYLNGAVFERSREIGAVRTERNVTRRLRLALKRLHGHGFRADILKVVSDDIRNL